MILHTSKRNTKGSNRFPPLSAVICSGTSSLLDADALRKAEWSQASRRCKVSVCRDDNLGMNIFLQDLDWNKNEDLFKYTAGRFLFNESHELSRRYIRFDMNELASIAARSVGSAFCRNVQKLSEGQYNRVFLLEMDDGAETIAKVPNPNAGESNLTTASEVATMDFVSFVSSTKPPLVR